MWPAGEKGKGLRSTGWQLPKSPGDVKDSTGDLSSDTVITTYSAKWAPDLPGGSLRRV